MSEIDDDVVNGLWPMELTDYQPDYSFVYRGTTTQTPFIAELSTSSKSMCRKCHKLISFNTLRIGALRMIPGVGKTFHFYHAPCFKRPHNLLGMSDVCIMDSLTEACERELQKVLTQTPGKRRKKKNKGSTKQSLDTIWTLVNFVFFWCRLNSATETGSEVRVVFMGGSPQAKTEECYCCLKNEEDLKPSMKSYQNRDGKRSGSRLEKQTLTNAEKKRKKKIDTRDGGAAV